MTPKNVWQIKGKNPGLNITIFGGVHGDELVGIEVVKKLKELFDLTARENGVYENDEVNGNIFLAFGNPQAIEQCTRAAGTGLDMNRMFGPKNLEAEPCADDQPDLVRARELAPILSKTDLHLDLHCTSTPTAPFIITTKVDLKRLLDISQFTSAQYIVLDPDGVYVSFLGLESNQATDDFVNNYTDGRAVGMCYETGYEKDISITGKVFGEVINILKHAGALSPKFLLRCSEYLSGNIETQKIYILRQVILAKEDQFKYESGMDFGWQTVKKGQIVGTYGSGEQEIVQYDGMYIFPKGESKVKTGDSLYYIAEPYK